MYFVNKTIIKKQTNKKNNNNNNRNNERNGNDYLCLSSAVIREERSRVEETTA